MSIELRPRAPRRAKISALGTYVPPRILNNADLAKLVDTSDEWIMQRLGIRERHLVEPGMATSDMAVEAARRCLAQRGIQASEVEVVIVATVTPDMLFPATACLVQDKLGAHGAWGFDLSAACSGLSLRPSGRRQAGRVRACTPRCWSSVPTPCRRSSTTPTAPPASFSATAPVRSWSNRPKTGEIGLIDFRHEIDGSGAAALNMPAGGSSVPASPETIAERMHYVHQDGQAVYKYAVRKMVETSSKLLEANHISANDLGCFIPHQANKRIILSTAERLGLPLERVIINIDSLRKHHRSDHSAGHADGPR